VVSRGSVMIVIWVFIKTLIQEKVLILYFAIHATDLISFCLKECVIKETCCLIRTT
jgi:hypothetical protein